MNDLIIVPVGVLLAVRLIPPDLTSEFRALAEEKRRQPAIGIFAGWLALKYLIYQG